MKLITRMTQCAALVLLAGLTGCASAPSEYYTLDMRPSGTVKSASNVVVGTILIPEVLAQKNLLIQKSPTQVEYYAVGEWAGSLDELFKNKLTAELGDPDAKGRTLVLTGELKAFEQVDVPEGAVAHLKLDGEFRETGKSRYTRPLLKKTYDITAPVNAPSANGTATALSRCVEKLAGQLADDAAKL